MTAFARRFHTTCCRRLGSPGTGAGAGVDLRVDVHAPGLGGRLHRRDGVVDDELQLDGLHVQPQLPREDARHVEDVVHDLGERLRVPLERLHRVIGLLAFEHSAAQKPRVADDRVQGSAKLVRQHREELVAKTAGLTGGDVQARVLERQRRPGRQADRHRLVLGCEPGRLAVAKPQRAEPLAGTALDRQQKDAPDRRTTEGVSRERNVAEAPIDRDVRRPHGGVLVQRRAERLRDPGGGDRREGAAGRACS